MHVWQQTLLNRATVHIYEVHHNYRKPLYDSSIGETVRSVIHRALIDRFFSN